MDENFFFTYGSLMEGEMNHHHLRHAWFVGEGVTYPTFELLDLGAYPAMVLYGRTAVHGEIYAVDDGTLEVLDRIEGHPHYYVRTRITLQNDLEVWAYLRARCRRAVSAVRALSGLEVNRHAGLLAFPRMPWVGL